MSKYWRELIQCTKMLRVKALPKIDEVPLGCAFGDKSDRSRPRCRSNVLPLQYHALAQDIYHLFYGASIKHQREAQHFSQPDECRYSTASRATAAEAYGGTSSCSLAAVPIGHVTDGIGSPIEQLRGERDACIPISWSSLATCAEAAANSLSEQAAACGKAGFHLTLQILRILRHHFSTPSRHRV